MQKNADIEYIVIDGASKDNTVQIINSFDERIDTVISEPDKGLYDALNKGLKLATGDIIGILHSDDFYPHASVINEIQKIFDSNPECEAVSASVEIFKGENFKTPFRNYDATKFKPWQFRMGIQPPHPGFFIKKNVLKSVGFFDIRYKISGDFDWLLRAIKVHKINVHYTAFVAVNMRDGGLSSSGMASKQQMNREDLQSLRTHHIYSNLFLIYLKYFIKLFQINFYYFLNKN